MNNYKPLILIAITITVISIALQISYGIWDMIVFMHHFMGMSFILFAIFKFLDLESFVAGFKEYDLIAKKSNIYAYLNPFIEFSLGLLYLSELAPLPTYIFTVLFMSISAVGVIKGILSPIEHKCACLGRFLDVPLSSISLVEDFTMLMMAIIMIFKY